LATRKKKKRIEGEKKKKNFFKPVKALVFLFFRAFDCLWIGLTGDEAGRLARSASSFEASRAPLTVLENQGFEINLTSLFGRTHHRIRSPRL